MDKLTKIESCENDLFDIIREWKPDINWEVITHYHDLITGNEISVGIGEDKDNIWHIEISNKECRACIANGQRYIETMDDIRYSVIANIFPDWEELSLNLRRIHTNLTGDMMEEIFQLKKNREKHRGDYGE